MESVIVRSPLVYGPGVRANFLRLLRWVDKEWPLPLGAIVNRRSLVSIWNLCDLMVHLLGSPVAQGCTWIGHVLQALLTIRKRKCSVWLGYRCGGRLDVLDWRRAIIQWPLARDTQHRAAEIDSHHAAVWPSSSGRLACHRTRTSCDIQHCVAGPRRHHL